MRGEGHMACATRPRYAIVLDDHPLIGRGIAQCLQVTVPELPVRVTTVWAQAQQWIETSGCPQVLVADAWLSGSSSARAFAEWRSCCRGSPWLATCDDGEPLMMRQARCAGAQGFVCKRALPEEFGRAIAAILAGGEWFEPSDVASNQRPRKRIVPPAELGLTPRQGDVLALVLRGLSNKRIALMLCLSESTVKEHMTGILQTLGVSSRVHAITFLRGSSLTVVGRQHHPHHVDAVSP